jgi:hypothetical protein
LTFGASSETAFAPVPLRPEGAGLDGVDRPQNFNLDLESAALLLVILDDFMEGVIYLLPFGAFKMVRCDKKPAPVE